MDISTPIIFFGIFVIACLSLFLVFKFGIKEKSYEEALAEQRQQTNALLGVKTKPKEKKGKKNTKKPKEKQQPSENEASEETPETPTQQKLHVAFKSEPEELAPKENSPIKKEELVKNEPAPKETKPKEKKQNDPEPIKPKKTKQQAPPPPEPTPVVVEKVEKKEEKKLETAPPPPAPSSTLPVNTGKEKKKKKSEFNTLQQLTAERDGLFTLVRKAELSRNEIQTLIELLLNKQHEAPTVVDDWSEGKSDPVQKLKKQLADKEKQLAEEKEASTGFQAKIREIRGEQQAEKSVLNQKIKSLEEALISKNVEAESHYNRLQGSLQSLQLSQNQCAEEIAKQQKLMEENKIILLQLKQAEMRIAQGQENENHVVHQLRADIQRIKIENGAILEGQQTRLAELQMEVEQLRLINKQLEETRQGLEMEINNQVRSADDAEKEISHLKTTLHQQAEEQRKIEFTLTQLQNERRQIEAEKAEFNKIIAQLKDELLKEKDTVQKCKLDSQKSQAELQKLREDFKQLETTVQLNGSSEEKTHKIELLNLNNQLSSIQSELQQAKQQLTETNSKNQTLQLEVEEQKAKNNVLTKDIITKEQDSQKQFIQRLFPEIQELKNATSNEDWQEQVGTLIQNHVQTLKKQRVVQESPDLAKAQAQVAKYKSIIDETEGQLIHLQSHIAQEEMNWREQLAEKDDEIEALKEEALLKLKVQIQEQESKLVQEMQKNETLNREIQQLKGRPQNTDAATTIERLTEEVNRLNELLRVEQSKKNGDVNGSSKEQNFKATNGLSLIEGNGN